MTGRELPLPPMCEQLKMTLVEAAAGKVAFTCHPDESHYHPIGAVHSGPVCTLLDSAFGCADHTPRPGLHLHLIQGELTRPVRVGSGVLTCVDIQAGKPRDLRASIVTDASGKLVATAPAPLVFHSTKHQKPTCGMLNLTIDSRAATEYSCMHHH
jgi:acyl-coenzyme A thioesterase PaaI-like protein